MDTISGFELFPDNQIFQANIKWFDFPPKKLGKFCKDKKTFDTLFSIFNLIVMILLQLTLI